jgi:hypothetical protein
MKIRHASLLMALLACLLFLRYVTRPEPLRVHEWGTFTYLQDQEGRTVSRINSDDEPVPAFVHRLWGQRIVRDAGDRLAHLSQGATPRHSSVVMRMETPVVYFHLPNGYREMEVSLSVFFKGGWITEFYPMCDLLADCHSSGPSSPIGLETWTHAHWRKLFLSRDADRSGWPLTDEHVWLAPRDVGAASVRAMSGESEQYVFYRGVGGAPCPIMVRHTPAGYEISAVQAGVFGPFWILNRQGDQFRFAKVGERTTTSPGQLLARPPLTDELSQEGVEAMRRSMSDELLKEGLHLDEAISMLETWKLSYFQSDGTRVFFLVGRQWTDEILPMDVSCPVGVETVRVMIGRVECVTQAQRSVVQAIIEWVANTDAEASAGVPASLAAGYESLGRFRDAIVLDGLRSVDVHRDRVDRILECLNSGASRIPGALHDLR